MYNITLISTRHDNVGECNSKELYQIIQGISPEVIFEEMPPSFFDKYYIERSRSTLETEAITMYLATNDAKHVPVDSDDMPADAFFNAHRQALERVEVLTDINGFNYRNLMDGNRHYAAIHGFKYLNSDFCIAYNDDICNAVEKALETINNDKFFQAHRQWHEIHDRRETAMLNNIYSYCEENSFNTAVFLLGSAHRKSIMQKIKNYKQGGVKLNWLFYGD